MENTAIRFRDEARKARAESADLVRTIGRLRRHPEAAVEGSAVHIAMADMRRQLRESDARAVAAERRAQIERFKG